MVKPTRSPPSSSLLSGAFVWCTYRGPPTACTVAWRIKPPDKCTCPINNGDQYAALFSQIDNPIAGIAPLRACEVCVAYIELMRGVCFTGKLEDP